MADRYYRINHQIRASQVRVIGEDGKQIGILPLNEALNIAREKELDLVEIAPTANPPVTKVIDYKKFLYQEEKKERETKKKAKGGEIKGIRIAPFIAQGDLDVRIKKAEEFLRDGDKVRVAVRFTGRQMGKKDFGYAILKRFVEALSTSAQPEGEPKWFGRELVLTITPVKHTGDKKGEENAKNENQKINSESVQTH